MVQNLITLLRFIWFDKFKISRLDLIIAFRLGTGHINYFFVFNKSKFLILMFVIV